MLKIVDLILEYKETHKESYAAEILKIIMPMIMSKAKSIRPDYKEDVIQDLKTSLFAVINIAIYKDVELSNSIFTNENLNYLMKEKFSKESLLKIFENKYIINFIEESGVDIVKGAFQSLDNNILFQNNFSKFNFRNQFFNILNKRFDSVIASFYRKNIDYLTKEQTILNRETAEGDEYIDLLPDPEFQVEDGNKGKNL